MPFDKPPGRQPLPVLRFFLVSHGLTWLFWVPLVVLQLDTWEWPNTLLLYLGGLGPPVAGLASWWLVAGRQGLADVGARLLQVSRIPVRWWLVIVLLPPALQVAAVVVSAAFSDGMLVMPFVAPGAPPLHVLGFALFIFMLGPLPEEIGWRGYALDALQSHFNALAASVLLGLAWALWHAPLFLMTGYYDRFEMAPDPWLFTYNILLHAILYTWIFNNTHRSLLGAVVFHFMTNYAGEMIPASSHGEAVLTALKTMLVLVVLAWWGPTRLRRRPANA